MGIVQPHISEPNMDDSRRLVAPVCAVATLTVLDMVTGKLLSNSDRWADDAAFSRVPIGLAMMSPHRSLLREAVAKAENAYGKSILPNLIKAIDQMQSRD